uniref:SSD domain-containing protein n=1 Tax=Panagrellus redivivus TaxID=6233 RepID=A0A7E4VMB3_PANRE
MPTPSRRSRRHVLLCLLILASTVAVGSAASTVARNGTAGSADGQNGTVPSIVVGSPAPDFSRNATTTTTKATNAPPIDDSWEEDTEAPFVSDEYDDTDSLPHSTARNSILSEHRNTTNPLNAPVGCVMRRVCGRHNKLSQNCAAHVYPVPLFNQKLLDLCPNVFSSRIFSSKTGAPSCCDDEQVDILRTQMSVAHDLLYKCPSCYSNFVNFWCHFSCSIKQQKFVKVMDTKTDKHSRNDTFGNPLPYVTRVKAYINKDYADAIFNSCKDVRFAGGYAMDAICGESRQTCTTKKLFAFMGKADGVHVPFNIQFELTHKEVLDDAGTRIVPLKVQTWACHEVAPLSQSACSCSDCLTACKSDLPYPAIEQRTYGFKDKTTCERVGAECRIASMECMSGLSVMTGGLIAAVLMGSILVYYCMGKSTDSDATISASPLAITAAGHHPLQMERHQPGPLPKKRTYRIDDRLIEWCQIYGRYAADHTRKLLCGSLVVAMILSLGLVEIRTTTDPVELWSNKESQLRKEKDFFDRTFSPFHRVEQIILAPRVEDAVLLPNVTRSNYNSYYGPVFNRTFLREAFVLIDGLLNLETISPKTGKTIRLNDICYKPMAPDNNNCAVMSLFSYFQNSLINFNATGDDEFFDYDSHTHLQQCISGPFTMQTYLKQSCLSDFGAPIEPYVILGDFNSTNDYFSARGMVVTILLENNLDKSENEDAAAWERAFINYLKDTSSDIFTFSYMAERSIEDEIDRASSSDKTTVIISYLFMFVYVAFALGQYKVMNNELISMLVKSKFILGISGVVVVALSVTSSIGIFAFYGIPATMIILEVMPFLILAVGVDNIFLLVQAYQRLLVTDPDLELGEMIAQICGQVIPSMMLSTLSESACFFLGAITDMPAVKTFSMYAGLAILLNFVFQITCFLALFIIDIKRQKAGRAEFFFWKKYQDVEPTSEESYMYRFFKNIFSPALLHNSVRMFVFVFFAGWFATSCYVMTDIRLGLDEKMAVPKDSYMLPHFNNMEKYMSVGPPVYFVIRGTLDYNDFHVNKLISGAASAHQYSLGSQINHAAKYPQNSYIAHPANNWIDDYTDWLRPGGDPPCCRFYRLNGSFCAATEPRDACDSCDVQYTNSRPDRKAFASHLNDFLLDNPSKKCTKGGKAQYGRSLDYHATRGIAASHFMTYHTPLRTQPDFIRAMDNARFIAKNITCTINRELSMLNKVHGGHYGKVEVFAYSPYYVFYEQYETIVWAAIVQLMLSLVVIFIVTFFLLGMDPWSAMIIVGTIACILINLIGLMYWWNIDFNAISVVNLVMSVGISVEFCSHIVRTYSLSMKRTRVERTHEALANIGCSVLSGITFTKFGGVMVLAFAHTQIFEIFYFRMFLGIVIIGGMHGLIFLPVLLSIVGPPLNKRRMQELLLTDNGYYAANTRLHLSSPMSPKSSKSCSDATGIKDVSVRQGLVFDHS